MKIYDNIFNIIVNYISSNTYLRDYICNLGYITSVTNMSIHHIDDNCFFFALKLYINKNIDENNFIYKDISAYKIMKNNVQVAKLAARKVLQACCKYNYGTENTYICLGKMKINIDQINIISINILNYSIHNPLVLGDDRQLQCKLNDIRIMNIGGNKLLLIGNYGDSDSDIFIYEYQDIDTIITNLKDKVYDVLCSLRRKNVLLYYEDNNIETYDYYDEYHKLILENKTKISEIIKTRYVDDSVFNKKIFVDNINNLSLSGSSNIIKLNGSYFAIFHKYIYLYNMGPLLMFFENDCIYKITIKNDVYEYKYNCILKNNVIIDKETLIKETKKHINIHYDETYMYLLYNIDKFYMHGNNKRMVLYFSYFAELNNDYFKTIKKISNPIYIKKNCYSGIHFVCGLTNINDNIVISYGIDDFDANIMMLSYDEFLNIIHEKNNTKICMIDDDINYVSLDINYGKL